MQNNLFKGRDKRQKGWFWMDNDYLNGYAKMFGAIGTAVYVSLCRHADNETQKCFPAQKLMAEELKVSENTISKYIKLFEKYRIISIEREKSQETKKWLNNVYTLLDKSQWTTHPQSLGVGIPDPAIGGTQTQPLGHNKTNTNKTNNTTYAESNSADINYLLSIFVVLNPGVKTMYGNITQRKACKHLIDTYGLKRITKVVSETLPKTNGLEYFPTITTPLQLQDKYTSLESAIRKYQSEHKIKSEKYPII